MSLIGRGSSKLIERQAEGNVTVDLFLLIGIFGFSLTFTFMFLLFGTTLFSVKLTQAGSMSLMVHIVLAASIVATLLFCNFFTKLIFNLRSALPILAMAFTTVNLWVEEIFFITPDSPILLIAWAITGIGFALLILTWSEYVALLPLGNGRLFFSASMCFGILWLSGFLLTDPVYVRFVAFVPPILTLLTFIFLRYNFQNFTSITFIDRKTTIERLHIGWKPILSTGMSSVALGFILSYLLASANDNKTMLFFLVACMFLTVLAVLVDSVKWKKLGENFLMRAFLLFVMVGMLPLLFLSDEGKAVCSILMICGLILTVALSNSALSEHIKLFNLAPMQMTAYGRLFSYLGVLLGFIFGYVAFWTNLFGEATLPIVTIVLIAIFIAEVMFVMMENNYPLDEEQYVSKGIYVINSDGKLQNGENPSAESKGIWRRKCEAISNTYGLSERQHEVFILLARGHNAEHITEELFISMHTAKAHIYNIYQKIGVHSRQELIDIVERVDTNLG